jgi:hypothetical protein
MIGVFKKQNLKLCFLKCFFGLLLGKVIINILFNILHLMCIHLVLIIHTTFILDNQIQRILYSFKKYHVVQSVTYLIIHYIFLLRMKNSLFQLQNICENIGVNINSPCPKFKKIFS